MLLKLIREQGNTLSEFQKLNDLETLRCLKPRLEIKSRLFSAIRNYFELDGFIGIETPVMIDAPAPEEYIEAPSVNSMFLRTSPELQMKRMLAAGYEKIYQIGSCFREGEVGQFHRVEFTMLEWYEVGANYTDLMNFTCRMLSSISETLFQSQCCEFKGHFIDFGNGYEQITVHEAFAKYTDTSPEQALADDSFDELLVDLIEPKLGLTRPTILKDYPAQCAALSRLKADNSTIAERWELYLVGIEIANAYSELTDPVIQRQRFAESIEHRRKTGYKEYPRATEFFEAIDSGIPESAGCALGLDRLTMIFTNSHTIADVVFPQ